MSCGKLTLCSTLLVILDQVLTCLCQYALAVGIITKELGLTIYANSYTKDAALGAV